jgi:hypothetical protein
MGIMADEGLAADLVQAAEAVAALAGDEDRFRATFDAFLAADRESYQRLLTEFKLLDRCELVCDWICSKYCVFVCLELCGPPTDVELPDLREFAAVVTRITQDEELVERLANTVADRDAEGFRALVAELKIERFCHLLCHWACSVRCRLLCRVVCSPTPTHIASFVEELALAGAAITTLAADERAMAEVTEAVLTGDCDVVRGVVQRLGLFQGCHLVCEWLCTWRCVRVCLLLCRRFPVEAIEDPLGEAFAFAQATARLAANPADLQRLGDAVAKADPETFGAVVEELQLGRFCIQLCQWLCRLICRRFCFCVCPPRSAAYFIRIGQYEYAEVYPPGGTVPRIDSQISGTGLTSDSRAFFRTLRLNGGYSLQTGAPQMEYKFETITTDAAGNPSPPATTWQPVLAGAAGGAGEPTIIGYNISFPPPLHTLHFTPLVVTPGAGGWIQVPLSSPTYVPTGDLLQLNTEILTGTPHLDETGVVAGASASQPLAEDVFFGIRMRVRNVGDPASEIDAGTCHHIAIDNILYDNVTHQPAWRNLTDPPGDLAVYLVDIQELLGPHGCGQITNSLTVLYTAAHPNLGATTLRMDGPGGPYAFTLTPDAASSPADFFGTAAPDGFVVSDLRPCAYLVTLSAGVLLTDGDHDPGPLIDQIAFCKR